jgi:hypothetical protein
VLVSHRFAESRSVALTATVPDAMFADLQSVRIRRREGRKTLIAVRRTKLAPRIVIVRPKTKTKLGERAIVRWKAVDGDTDRGDLRFQVAYSPSNGRAFVPVGVGLSGSSFAFDARQVRRAWHWAPSGVRERRLEHVVRRRPSACAPGLSFGRSGRRQSGVSSGCRPCLWP